MASSANGDRQAVVPRGVHASHHVGGVPAAGDGGGSPVDHAVPDRSRGVVCRGSRFKKVASHLLEAEIVTVLVHRVSGATLSPADPIVWLWVLLFMSLASLVGFALTASVISLAVGRQSYRQWIQPVVIAVIGGFANCSLGLVVVALA